MSEKETKNFLAHYGVLGMKWGVTTADDGSKRGSTSDGKKGEDQSTSVDEYLAAKGPKLSKKEQAANIAKNNEAFLAKAGLSEPPPKSKESGFHLTGEQVTQALLGAAFVGLIAYSAIRMKPPPAGTRVALSKYIATVNGSKIKSWSGVGNGYIKKSSFAQKEFTLAKGHEFTRISTNAESAFMDATYAVHNVDDYHRYIAAFRHEKGIGQPLHKVTFTATDDIKIPNLKTRLDTLTESMSTDTFKPSPEQVMTQYNFMSGGSWMDSKATSFFDALSKKGYGGIIDDMDAGVIGQSPLVLFKNQSLGTKTSKPITAEDIKDAESKLFELANRK